MMRDATPGQAKEITTSVIPHGEFPKIKFWWKKAENPSFFNLSFYINGELAEPYNNGKSWDKVLVYDLKKYNSNSYKLKWHLEYNPEIKYIDIPPSSNAFINGLELCDLLFENESLVNSSCPKPIKPTKPKNIFPVNSTMNLNEIIAQIVREQKQGNFTITILELEPGTYNLTNTLEVKELQDLKIKGDNDLLTKINSQSNKFAINISNSSNITIQNLVFEDNNGCIDSQDCFCIDLQKNSHDCFIYNNFLNNFRVGIVIDHSERNNVSRNIISSYMNNSYGICLTNSSFSNNLTSNDKSIAIKDLKSNIREIISTEYMLGKGSHDNTIIIDKDVEKCVIWDDNEGYAVCSYPQTGFKMFNSNMDCQNVILTKSHNTLKLEEDP